MFKALADPSRRELLDRLHRRSGQTLGELCAGLGMARQSVSKHLAVLQAAGVVTVRWRGREKLHFLDAAPVNEIADRWIRRHDRPRAQALADLKRRLENPVTEPDFVHTTYIDTTPEKLWRALTDPAFTREYWWGTEQLSTWNEGAPMTWDGEDDPEQVVLESDPPRRLSYTWHTFTTTWAERVGIAEELRARLAAESRSRVTFEIEPEGALVKLTVVHGGFEPGSTVRAMVGEGWPLVVSSLKSYLETGRPLPAAP